MNLIISFRCTLKEYPFIRFLLKKRTLMQIIDQFYTLFLIKWLKCHSQTPLLIKTQKLALLDENRFPTFQTLKQKDCIPLTKMKKRKLQHLTGGFYPKRFKPLKGFIDCQSRTTWCITICWSVCSVFSPCEWQCTISIVPLGL